MSAASEQIAKLLRTDPLVEAERLSGKSYKDDPDTLHVGMALAMLHGAHKETVLRESGDSYMNMQFDDAVELFAALGFTEVYRETFVGRRVDETYLILWHPEGLLATCESFDGTHRNSAKVYYNYRPNDEYPDWGLTSSGRMHGGVWVGDHDAREGIRHNLDAMRAAGRFVSVWSERPFLWLLNYTETDGESDHEALNEAKIAALPETVRSSIEAVS